MGYSPYLAMGVWIGNTNLRYGAEHHWTAGVAMSSAM